MKPLISIICPVYNGSAYFEHGAISSILSQTYTNFEFIIIDDGSIDDTPQKLKKIVDPRIKLLFPGRIGFVNCLNLGIEKAKSDLIIRQDFDDISYPNRLEEQVKFMLENPNVSWCGSYSKAINKIRNQTEIRQYPTKNKDIIKHLAHSIPWEHTLIIFRKSAVLQVGGYPLLGDVEDYQLGINLAKAGWELANIPLILGEHLEHENSFWNSNFTARERQRKFRKVQLKAITDLKLSKWNYILIFARKFYWMFPNPIKKIVRKIFLNTESV